MDKLNRYRDIIEKILTEVKRITKATPEDEYRTIFDRNSDSYALVEIGWRRSRRIHHIVIHLELINGKVWLQADNTDLIIARELELAGIPKTDIVLGFHPPHIRPHTDYAAA